MTQNNKKYYTFAVATLIILLAAIFAISRWSKSIVTLPIGTFAVTDGRIETRTAGTRDWVTASEGDKATTGVEIRVGGSASATIRGETLKIIISPDSNITTKGSAGLIELRVESGELKIETGTVDVSFAITTDFGQVQLNGDTTLTVTKPAGKPYAVVIVQKGEATLKYEDGRARDKIASKQTPEMAPKVLSTSTQQALWLISPGPEDIIAGKEGFAAMSLQWGGNGEPGNVLLRNLTSGEMITHENVLPNFEVTLPTGSYSWVVNSAGAVTTPRRFHITGQNEDAAATTLVPADKAETPAEPKPTDAPTEDAPPEREAPAVKILEPKKGILIPVSAIAEKRVAWSVTAPADSLELEVLGSSGNPSLRFTLDGKRSRQKLTPLPPGRYAVRLRGITGSGEKSLAGDWSESFFDVIQTEAGQMAPTEVKATLDKTDKPSKLFIQWQKSPARQYQVRVISAGEPATIIRSKKPKVVLTAPKSGTATISVCALDANLHIRGCAPDINVP
jgi:hypothetical protein